MNYTEKAIVYMGNYLMLFIASISIETINSPIFMFNLLMFVPILYIIWIRDKILTYHVLGMYITCDGGKFKKFCSAISKMIIGLVIIKLIIMDFYQYVLLLYVIDYFTWAFADRSLSHIMTLCTIERSKDESKA